MHIDHVVNVLVLPVDDLCGTLESQYYCATTRTAEDTPKLGTLIRHTDDPEDSVETNPGACMSHLLLKTVMQAEDYTR